MSKTALLNLIVGFIAIFTAAAAGAFLGLEITENSVAKMSESWSLTLRKSAHGHTNLFGYLHILFGLTIPYSRLSMRMKNYQTVGLIAGTLAMSVGMYLRSFSQPSTDVDLLSIVVAAGLTLALTAIALHIYGLILKFTERN
jgi:hypothetical protein